MSAMALSRASARLPAPCSTSRPCISRSIRARPVTFAMVSPERPSGAGRSGPERPTPSDDSIPVTSQRPSGGAGRMSPESIIKDDDMPVDVQRPSGASRGGGPGNGGNGGGGNGGSGGFSGLPFIFLLLGLIAGGAYALNNKSAVKKSS